MRSHKLKLSCFAGVRSNAKAKGGRCFIQMINLKCVAVGWQRYIPSRGFAAVTGNYIGVFARKLPVTEPIEDLVSPKEFGGGAKDTKAEDEPRQEDR